jgi:hypothetical protein
LIIWGKPIRKSCKLFLKFVRNSLDEVFVGSARHTEAELCLSDRAVVIVPYFLFLPFSVQAALKLN